MMESSFFAPTEVFVGRDVGGRSVTIRSSDVERYEAGTGDDNRWPGVSRDGETTIAPALLFHSEVYRDLSWYLPNLIGNLHAKQEWDLFNPFRVGDTVRTRSTIVDRYRKRNRDYIVNEVLITDADGRWLQRSRTHQSFLCDDPGDVAVDKDRERRPERRFEIGGGPGERLGPLPKAVSLSMCEAFSGPGKNYHTDQEMARALGFPDVVVQGMMSICFLSELMTKRFGLGWICGGKLNVSLVNVLWGNEQVSAHGQVREQHAEGKRTRVVVDVWCEKVDGTKTIVGTASALMAAGDSAPAEN
jgi:acyl dehydratase